MKNPQFGGDESMEGLTEALGGLLKGLSESLGGEGGVLFVIVRKKERILKIC